MRAILRTPLAISAGMAMAICAGPVFGQGQAASDNSSNAQPSRTIQLVQVQAELSTTLDAKKAKQGEAVTAKLANNVQIPNAEALPKNTVLEGHVDQVQPSEHKSDSTLVVTFDKAKLKGGKELPIKATIISVSEPVNQLQQNQGGAPAGGAGAMPSGPGAMPGGGAQAGGPGGGAGSASSAPAAQPAPMPQEGGQGAEQQAQQQSGKNGVPGVMLTSDIHQHTSATFSSKGRNVKVPSGTQMQVALAVIPPGVNLQ